MKYSYSYLPSPAPSASQKYTINFAQVLNNDPQDGGLLVLFAFIWSTPTYFINGAEAAKLSSQSSLQDWQQKIDSLLAK